MSDSVSKLKELLFDSEAATLSELSKRLAHLASLAEAERQTSAELARRIEELQRQDAAGKSQVDAARNEISTARFEIGARLNELGARVGTPEALRVSVAEVLDEAFTTAREVRQDQLSHAVAPLLVKTIKAELRNNQAEMVEALYPITGQLVKAYVATAMKDMMRQMNRRLELSPMMLRFRSLMSGYSRAELALADSQRLEVEELYLIRRGSGALVQRWPEAKERSNSDIHMSGIIAAINDFASTAFQDDGGNLRSFDMGDVAVYLRASPVYLLAAKCRGTAITGVERMMDDAFLRAISDNLDHARTQTRGGWDADNVQPGLLLELHNRLQDGIADRHEVVARAGLPFNPLKAVATLLALVVLAGAGWYGWTQWEARATRLAAQDVIQKTASLEGFPVQLDVGYRGRHLDISGLLPSDAAREDLLASLRARLAAVDVRPRGLGVLPPATAAPDITPHIVAVRRDVRGVETTLRNNLTTLRSGLERDIGAARTAAVTTAEQAAIRRSLLRAERRLLQARDEMAVIAGQAGPNRRDTAAPAQADLTALLGTLAQERTRLLSTDTAAPTRSPSGSTLTQMTISIDRMADRIATLLGAPSTPRRITAPPPAAAPDAPSVQAQSLALAAERLATVTTAVAQIGSIRIPPPATPSEPTPRERLQAFAATNAVFFGDVDAFRAPEAAGRTLDQLATLLRGNELRIRLVGYTDERGGTTRNSEVAQLRAQKISEELVSRGIARNRLLLVGRATGPDLSAAIGPQSPNRRVQFELAFDGEVAPDP